MDTTINHPKGTPKQVLFNDSGRKVQQTKQVICFVTSRKRYNKTGKLLNDFARKVRQNRYYFVASRVKFIKVAKQVLFHDFSRKVNQNRYYFQESCRLFLEITIICEKDTTKQVLLLFFEKKTNLPTSRICCFHGFFMVFMVEVKLYGFRGSFRGLNHTNT